MSILVEHGKDISGTTAQRPASAEPGQRYFDTTLNCLLVWDGTSWRPAAGIFADEILFTEEGAGTYTGTVTVPAGATIVDIIVQGDALWDAATSASLEVGDDNDPDGFYTAVDLKATDLLAEQSLSFAQSGGCAGAYNVGTNTHWTDRRDAVARTITATVVSSGAGTAGRTRVVVIYAMPTVRDAEFVAE